MKYGTSGFPLAAPSGTAEVRTGNPDGAARVFQLGNQVTTVADDAVTLTAADAGTILVPNTVARTITLPAVADTAGLTFTFVKTTAAAAAITLDGADSEEIDGSTTYASMDAQYDSVTIRSTGTEWVIVAAKIA